MPSAIGGLTPEYRGADIRCGLNERPGCGQNRHSRSDMLLTQHRLAGAVGSVSQCGASPPKQPFNKADLAWA